MLKVSKKQKVSQEDAAAAPPAADQEGVKVIAQFVSPQGEPTGPQIEVPANSTLPQLKELINHMLSNEDPLPYSFFFNEEEILGTLQDTLTKQNASSEAVATIVYQPQAGTRFFP